MGYMVGICTLAGIQMIAVLAESRLLPAAAPFR